MNRTRNQIQENDRLFNLAIPEARQFLTDFISAKIDEFGLDCFRNDANIAPLEFWRAADTPDRQGITEIRWVEGFYAFWDELRRRHPKLIIDDCASGGRRLDLRNDWPAARFSPELISWEVCSPISVTATVYFAGCRCMRPLPGSFQPDSDYRIHSSMTAGLCYALFVDGDNPQGKTDYENFPFHQIRNSVEQYRKVQKYFYGDFYPLTEYTQAEDA